MTSIILAIISTLLSVAILCSGLFLLLYLNGKKLNRQKYLEAYARKHGYSYATNGDIKIRGMHPYGKLHDIVTGNLPLSNNKFDLFYQSNARSNTSIAYNRSVLRVSTPDIRSHFIINSRLDTMILADGSFDIYNYKYTIRFEGSFSDYFKVLAPSGDEQDIYTILAPNVMEYLIKHFHDLDIEIVDGETYIYSYSDTSPEKMLSIIDKADEFLRHARLRLSDARAIELGRMAGQATSRTATDNLVRNTFRNPRDVVPFIVVYFIGTIFLFLLIDGLTDIKGFHFLLPLMIFGPIAVGWVYSIVFIIKRLNLKRRHKAEISRDEH